MISYPVIYTRTLNCDYFSNFHVLPDFVDANWLLPYIRSATTDMNPTSNQTKRIVVSDKKNCVFGIIAYAKDIIKLTDCCRDNKGRAVYGFYGFAVKIDENLSKIPIFSKDDISEMYKQYIVPVWNATVSHTQTSLSVLLSEKIPDNTAEIKSEFSWNESVNVFSSENNLYEELLYKAITGDIISYCSCIDDYKALKKASFNYVVTSSNNLNRLKNESILKEESDISAIQSHYDGFEEDYKYIPPSHNSDLGESKKNKHMDNGKNFSEESFPEKELKSELENLMKKYFNSSSEGSIAVTIIIEYLIFRFSQRRKQKKMPNELEVFDSLSVNKKIPEADDLMAYYKIHSELCRQYQTEIEHIYRLLKELRDERLDFLENKVTKIRHTLEIEKIDSKAIEVWISQLKDDMDRSFRTSEEFLNNFIVAKTAEFEAKLKERLEKI